MAGSRRPDPFPVFSPVDKLPSVWSRDSYLILACAASLAVVVPGIIRVQHHMRTVQFLVVVVVVVLAIVTVAIGIRFPAVTRESVYASVFFILLIFGLRVAFDLSSSDVYWVNINVTDAYFTALAAVWAMAASYVAVYVTLRLRWGSFETGSIIGPTREEARYFRVASYVLGAVGWLALVVTVLLAGGLGSFIHSRESFTGVVNVPAVQYAMMFGICGSLLRVYLAYTQKSIIRSRDLWIGIGIAAPILLVTLAQGSRRYALAALVAGIVGYFLVRGKTVPVMRTLLGVLVIVLFVLMPLESVRSGGDDRGESFGAAVSRYVTDPSGAVQGFFASQSTSMLSASAMGLGDYDTMAGGLGWGRYTAAETVLQPIPQQVWHSKPESLRNELIDYRYGRGDSGCSSLCPTFGPANTFLADFGLPGVILAGGALGLFGAVWLRLCARLGFSGAAAYAGSFWGFVYMWWSSLSALTLIVLLIGVPPLVIKAAIELRRGSHGSNRIRERISLMEYPKHV
ncbi:MULTISPECIES: hypothetical protein [unclassified Gordonia (in: high G+C Gram-positive bacteria)]|uniref:hypothetical protein n=1 Tax=unclassified Gordonia (in: high G+C Gram-positive bacteria) TaxID=2657482 RepID=UPI0010F981CB|nr:MULTISPECIES: hypothetical protein [unclassified Gordonia (in: high G+C Gram-positive bacteria)]